MTELSEMIRKIVAGITREAKYHLEDVKIFFKAPDPHHPGSETITIEADPAKEANFQWVAYQALFSISSGEEDPKYYIYNVGLEPNGVEKLPNKVFESDSSWSAKNKDMPSQDFTPGEAKRTFPEALKGPNMHPEKHVRTTYVNTDASDRAVEYSDKEFKKLFDNLFYVVLNPHSRDLKNPYGRKIGKTGVGTPEEETPEEETPSQRN